MKSFSNAPARAWFKEVSRTREKRTLSSSPSPFKFLDQCQSLLHLKIIFTRVLLQVFHNTCGNKTPNNLEHRNPLMHFKLYVIHEWIPHILNCHSRILNFTKSPNSNVLLKVKEKCTNAGARMHTYMHTCTYIYIYIPIHLHLH